MKRCCKCKGYRALNSYCKDKNRKDGLYPVCKSCTKKYALSWRNKNKNKISKDQAAWYKNNVERKRLYNQKHKEQNRINRRSAKLKSVYGITLMQYNKMLKKQKNRCAICDKKQLISLGVDHNHSTQQIRGLLCRECNLGLGHFQDSLMLLVEAQKYMEKYS